MAKDEEPNVAGRIEVFAEDWTFYPDSLNSRNNLEADILFLNKCNPSLGSVFLKKLPNYAACQDHLRKRDFKRYAKCITTMHKV